MSWQKVRWQIGVIFTKKRLGWDFWNVFEYIHFRPVPAFYLAHGDMFRAQGHLLTPPELRDTTVQSPKRSLSQWNPFVWHNGISIDFQEIWRSLRLWTVVSWSSDGVRRCSWALNMSPWANWNGRIDLKWKYSLIWTWKYLQFFFHTNSINVRVLADELSVGSL